ncbi:MAG: hypothetical protein ACU837_06475 [Gammaproteobacteria bacterium]
MAISKTIILNATALLAFAASDAGATASTQCTSSQPGSPCYAQDNDILDGNWNLLPDSDLLLSYNSKNGSSLAFSSQIFETSGSTVSTSAQISNGGYAGLAGFSSPQPAVAVGHFWEIANQGAVTFHTNGSSGSGGMDFSISYDATTQQQPLVGSATLGSYPVAPHIALAADFDHDGYDEIVLIYHSNNSYYAQFFTANDRAQPQKGMKALGSPLLLGQFSIPGKIILPTAVGDFNGDGNFDLAIGQPGTATSPFTLIIDTVVPDMGSGTFKLQAQNGGKPIPIGAITTAYYNGSVSTTPYRAMSMAAGEFDGSPQDGDELVVAYITNGTKGLKNGDFGTEYSNAVVAKIAPNWTAKALYTQLLYDSYLTHSCGAFCTAKGPLWTTNVQVKTGRFNPNAVNDNAAVLISLKDRDSKYLTVNHKDGPALMWGLRPHYNGAWLYAWDKLFSGNAHTLPGTPSTTLRCIGDIAIGRFDPPSISGPGDSQTTDASQQLAIAGSNTLCDHDGSASLGVGIYTVNADALGATAMSLKATSGAYLTNPAPVAAKVTWDPYASPAVLPFALNPQDTQGRSVQLGQPTVVRVHKREPTFIVESPAMHADWIGGASPTPGNDPACNLSNLVAPCFLNISLLPSQFYTDYSSTASTSVQVETQATSSWSAGTKQTFDAKLTFGVPLVDNVKTETKESASYTYSTNASLDNTLNKSFTLSIDTKTGFGDVVAYTDYWQNIYSYPVLNQSVCPADQPGCPPSAQLPLVINYAAPDTVNHYRADGSTQDWFQPPHEPGNIFSYPCNEDAALSTYGDGGPTQTPLSLINDWLFTDTSQTTDTVSWSQNTGTSQSVGSNNQYASDFSQSVSAKVTDEVGTDKGTVGIDINNSASWGKLTTSTRTTSATSSIAIVKPGFSLNVQNNYQYGYNSLILGAETDAIQFPGYQTLPSYPNTQGYQTVPQIETGGPFAVRYIADPNADGSTKPFWKTNYNVADIAVNHPRHFAAIDGATDQYAFIPQTPSAPSAGYPVDYGFYAMKGFFVTSQSQQSLPTPAGPNLQSANDGDVLTLWARVYNYSFGKVPSGAIVKARFYRQEIDNSKGELIAGTLQQIGDATMPHGVSPFPNSDVNALACTAASRNWELVNVAFDTAGLSGTIGKDYLFWVVAWMEDSSGNVLKERPDHGLGDFDPNAQYSDLTELPVEGHSNNVGLYNAGFHIYPPLTAQAATGQKLAAAAASKTPLVDLVNFKSRKARVVLGKQTTLSVRSVAGDQDLGPHSIYFYDRYQNVNGVLRSKLFDSEHIVHIDAHRSYLARASFQPESCGVHTLVAKIKPGQWQRKSAFLDVEVVLPPVRAIKKNKAIIAKNDALSGIVKQSLLAKLNASQQAFEEGDSVAGLSLYYGYYGLLQQIYDSGDVSQNFYRYLRNKYNVFRTCMVNASAAVPGAPLAEGPRTWEE